MAARPQSTPLVELSAVALAPFLVMLMLGSLTFFLIEVTYSGQYTGRLLYTFFFYVAGAVLVARLTITHGRGRAAGYGLALGAACFVAMMAFVEYPPGAMQTLGPLANVAIMALVSWSAHQLTWDCTHFDDARKSSGRGVLAAAGIDASPEADQEDEDAPKPKANQSWLERYEAYKQHRKSLPHTPGVWVAYFALAALPLFALGQSLIPADDGDRRRATFLQMGVYIGSALGLLVTTSLMSLKRYLEDRGAKIPAPLALGWLGLGGGLIMAFLVVGAILPRPHSETALVDLGLGGKSQRNASNNAVVRDGNAGKGEGAEGTKQESDPNGKRTGDKSGNGPGKGDKGQGGQGKNGEGKGGQDRDQQNKQRDDGGNNAKSDEKADGKSGQKGGDKGKAKPGEKSEGKSEQGEKSDPGDKSGDSQSSGPSKILQALESFGSLLRWVVWIVVAVAVIAGVVYFCLKGLAPFTDWAKNLLAWLRGLFGRKPREAGGASEEEAAPVRIRRPPPFETLSNPFADGRAGELDPAELVEETFAALDSWAWDRGEGRTANETPLEFAARLGNLHERLDAPAFATAELYVRVAYGRGAMGRGATGALQELWREMGARG